MVTAPCGPSTVACPAPDVSALAGTLVWNGVRVLLQICEAGLRDSDAGGQIFRGAEQPGRRIASLIGRRRPGVGKIDVAIIRGALAHILAVPCRASRQPAQVARLLLGDDAKPSG